MKFTVAKPAMVKMLKAVATGAAVPYGSRDAHLRVEARDATLILTANAVQAECPAQIEKEGVVYIFYKSLLPIVRSFKAVRVLTVQIAPEGLQIENFRLSQGIWIALFDNPASAPQRLLERNDPQLATEVADDSIQAWRDFYARS